MLYEALRSIADKCPELLSLSSTVVNHIYDLGYKHGAERKGYPDGPEDFLNTRQRERFLAWKKGQDESVAESQGETTPYYGAIGGEVVWSYCRTGIGEVIKARNELTGDEIDLTEYDRW